MSKLTHSQDKTDHLNALGTGKLVIPTNGPSTQILETFSNNFPNRLYMIEITFPEFTSLCPVTGQPDFATISLEYIPNKLCVESKSYKLYMMSYRNHQSFMETITNNVLDHICTVLSPYWCRVKGIFTPRGATYIHVFAEQYTNENIQADKMQTVHSLVKEWKQDVSTHKMP